VYDVAGRLHAILDLQQGAENRINMNGTGVYLVRIAGGDSTFSEKVILK